MAYDEELARRIGAALAEYPEHAGDVTEQRMFGGLAFLLRGRMAAAATKGGLMLRCDPAETDQQVAAGAERMVMRGRELDGWLLVPETLVADEAELAKWVGIGVAYAASLPPKARAVTAGRSPGPRR
ncbi:TfoX/Sxy family protein [Microlunatus parietis]|uniref:TfoX/Sxy family transcriptional regulator of competence genes n=1 Tax=Microlunatus parietis TaxID=682979 RepID=A0A7Y9LDH5_9ACTN|nr:TfoX/Sxy family protein [Microlunatus parietis]NYE72883.1 TfoX/Sxy family transcriptional regulator of competence genes [Microlunatus parietis]